MNKNELITSMAEKSGLTKKDAEKALGSFIDAVQQALKDGDKVQLIGFGSFEVKERAERKGRNPQSKEEIVIPASKAPVFKAGKALKDQINVQQKSRLVWFNGKLNLVYFMKQGIYIALIIIFGKINVTYIEA